VRFAAVPSTSIYEVNQMKVNPIFYVYVYLDPRKPGTYIYDEYSFDYEPFYVGKGSNNRLYYHIKDGYHSNNHILNKIKKIQLETGCDPIIIKIMDQISEEISFNLEKHIIQTIGRVDLHKGPLCNFTEGGEGSSNPSDETRKKMSERAKKRTPSFSGKQHTDESKRKMSESAMGRKNTLEHRKKISEARKGIKKSEETKKRMSDAMLGNNNKSKYIKSKIKRNVDNVQECLL